MGKLTIEDLKNGNKIAYEYVRGSWAHGIAIEGVSDVDLGGVYFADENELWGLRSNYKEQVSDSKGDIVYYEFGRWMELLLSSNPTVMESLFIDKKFINKVHPLIQEVINNRDMFLTKEFLKPTWHYAMSQIKKAKGLNKKCNIPDDFSRKDILDFCYTFKNQGSQPIKEFLKEHHLGQKYCGLVNIPNMKDTYGVYYDWAAYFKFENIDWYKLIPVGDGKSMISIKYPYNRFIGNFEGRPNGDEALRILNRIENKEFFGYKGIVEPDDIEKSNEVRLSSIPKGEKPICFMTYNKDGYTTHCREYKEWIDWKEHRNPVRYENNKGYNYDGKNLCECVRLLHTGIDVLSGKGYIVERTTDRDFLLSIKKHELSYDEIIAYIEKKQKEFERLYDKCALPDKIDRDIVNKFLIDIRKKYYNC